MAQHDVTDDMLTLLRNAFAADVLDAIRELREVEAVDYVASEFAMGLRTAGSSWRWQLDGIFRQSVDDGLDERRERVQANLRAFLHRPAVGSWEASQELLMPVIRSMSYLTAIPAPSLLLVVRESSKRALAALARRAEREYRAAPHGRSTAS